VINEVEICYSNIGYDFVNTDALRASIQQLIGLMGLSNQNIKRHLLEDFGLMFLVEKNMVIGASIIFGSGIFVLGGEDFERRI